MPVSLSVKNVPEALAAALRRRARQHHRSLQGELLAILDEAVAPTRASQSRLSAPSIAPRSESALVIRAARDARTKTIADVFDELARLERRLDAELSRSADRAHAKRPSGRSRRSA